MASSKEESIVHYVTETSSSCETESSSKTENPNVLDNTKQDRKDSDEATKSEKWPRKCDHCDYVGTLSKYMKRHLREKHPDQVANPLPLLKCQAKGCNFVTRNKMTWIRHGESHTKGRVFQCLMKGCKVKPFPFHHLLITHLASAHNKTNVYVCDKFKFNKKRQVHEVCYKKFEKPSELKKHISRFHPEKSSSVGGEKKDTGPKILCPKCDKVCKTRKGFTDHLMKSLCGKALVSDLEAKSMKKPAAKRAKMVSDQKMSLSSNHGSHQFGNQVQQASTSTQIFMPITTTPMESSISIFEPFSSDVPEELLESVIEPCANCHKDQNLMRKHHQDWLNWHKLSRKFQTSCFALVPCPEFEMRQRCTNVVSKQDLVNFIQTLPDNVLINTVVNRSRANFHLQ